MSRRSIGIFTLILGALAAIGELRGIDFPTARWFFEASRDVPLLKWKHGGGEFLWFGWVSSAILVIGGVSMVVASFTGGPPNPVTLRRMKRFREIKRGYFSLIILLGLAGLAALGLGLARRLWPHEEAPRNLDNRAPL